MIFKKKKNENNFMLYIPMKNRSNWMQKDNVIYPIFKHDNLIDRFVAWLTRKPTIRDIRLDKLCTRVWQLIDGSNNVYRIGQILIKEFDKDCEPVYERLTVYLRFLSRRGWIRFKKKSDLSNSNANL
ncbi:MAG: pyrroloquinoline quinone biosynthesis protein [Clostridiales bacterium GWB2_37_7]|nr:MAG: pyrroloquinoline quinone biosynthesis protein [Clostridiales bacterium GWB2_37_7]